MEFVEIAEDVSREDVLASRPAGDEKLRRGDRVPRGRARRRRLARLGRAEDARRAPQTDLGADAAKRAAQELEVEHERRGFPSSTWWRLPSHANPSPEEFGMTGRTRMNTGIAGRPLLSHAKFFGDRRWPD